MNDSKQDKKEALAAWDLYVQVWKKSRDPLFNLTWYRAVRRYAESCFAVLGVDMAYASEVAQGWQP